MRSLCMSAVAFVACAMPPAPGTKTAAPKEITPPLAAPASGRMIELGRFGDADHTERRVRAWLPPGHQERTPYPVLYVFDGQAASTLRIPETLDGLLARGLIEPWIAVLVDSGFDRRGELAMHAESTADFLADVIAPAVASRMSVRAGSAVLGYSYGGLASLRVALHRPELFDRVVAMSPSVWWRQRAVVNQLPRDRARLPVRMWIDAGTDEGGAYDIVPDMVHDARALRDAAIERGMVMGRDLGYLEEIGEPHDFAAAGRRMDQALAFALSDADYSALRPREVQVFVYPQAPRAVWQTFAVHAHYEAERRMTWPVRDAEIRLLGGERELYGDLVRPLGAARIVARVQGISSQR